MQQFARVLKDGVMLPVVLNGNQHLDLRPIVPSLAEPYDPISRGPNNGVKLDWEVELAIVIGRETRDIAAADAPGYVFGYVCCNDIADRTTQVDQAAEPSET